MQSALFVGNVTVRCKASSKSGEKNTSFDEFLFPSSKFPERKSSKSLTIFNESLFISQEVFLLRVYTTRYGFGILSYCMGILYCLSSLHATQQSS